MLDSTGTTAVTVSVSVSVRASPSALVRDAVTPVTPPARPDPVPAVGSIEATVESATAKVAAGMGPLKGAPFWSNPTTVATYDCPTAMVNGPTGMVIPPDKMT